MNTLNTEGISNAFTRLTKQQIFKIIRTRTGISSIVHKIELKNGLIYYFKQGSNNYELQKLLCDTLKTVDVPTPKIIYADNSFLIEEGVIGNKMNIKDRANIKKVLTEFGIVLAKVHNIKTRNYGPLKNMSSGIYKNYFKNFEKILYLIPKKYHGLIVNYLHQKHSTCLNHGDVAPDHIYTDGYNFKYLIDWDDILSAPKEFDLSELFINLNFDKDYWQIFISSYLRIAEDKTIDTKKILIASLLQVYENYYWYTKDNRHDSKELTKILSNVKSVEDMFINFDN